MTTQEIRANIHVFNFHNDSSGAVIRYMWADEMTSINLGPTLLQEELRAIGSIEDTQYIDHYQLTQWDAFNLVVRAHLSLEIQKDSNILAIDKAINSLNQNY